MSDLSRAVSHALRHEPWVYELELDDQGWVSVAALVAALQQEIQWSSLTIADVKTMVARASKQRHAIQDDRIRALYGHSVPGRIRYVPGFPPPRLFHGTSRAAALSIRVEGLRPMSRQFVHLSADRDTARAVGSRKGSDPVVLVIDARAAAEAGVTFHVGHEKVWLADAVPPDVIGDDLE